MLPNLVWIGAMMIGDVILQVRLCPKLLLAMATLMLPERKIYVATTVV